MQKYILVRWLNSHFHSIQPTSVVTSEASNSYGKNDLQTCVLVQSQITVDKQKWKGWEGQGWAYPLYIQVWRSDSFINISIYPFNIFSQVFIRAAVLSDAYGLCLFQLSGDCWSLHGGKWTFQWSEYTFQLHSCSFFLFKYHFYPIFPLFLLITLPVKRVR